MKAVILVGGKGTRLLPLTLNVPKAMVPVLNLPFLELAIRNLSQYPVEEIILAQGHLSRVIEDYFGDGRELGVKILYSSENIPLGTAGAIKNAESYLTGTYLVLNGDSFIDLDVTAMLDFHQKKHAKVTIVLTPVSDPTSYGIVETDIDSRVTRFIEKPNHDEVTTNLINAGVYIIEPEVLAEVPLQTQFSIEREVFPRLLGEGKAVYGYATKSYWLDMGTPANYLQLHRDLLGGKCPQHAISLHEGISIGSRTQIDSTVRIVPPVLIGDGCSIENGAKLTGPVTIGNGCKISENCLLQDCVILNNVTIERGVKIESSIVGNGSILCANSYIDRSVLGDNVTVPRGQKLDHGNRIFASGPL